MHECTGRTSVRLDQSADELISRQSSVIRDLDAKDSRRGVEGTFMWFMEEVGELSAALRGGTPRSWPLEFADVLAWLATLANIAGVDLDAAVRAKYGGGCPGCGQQPVRLRPGARNPNDSLSGRASRRYSDARPVVWTRS